MQGQVSAVIFDVGGVLVSPPQASIGEYEKELQLPRGLIATVFIAGTPNNAFCRMERGELTLSQFIPVFEQELHSLARSRRVELPCGFSALELFKRIAVGYNICNEMMEAALQIKDRGLKTCIVTNNWIDDITNYGHKADEFTPLFVEIFDVVIQSSKVGLRKPDPEIFRLALRELQVEPHEAVFLDDLGVNLKSARELGLTTIKVVDPVTAVLELGSVLGLTLNHRASRL